MSDTQEEVDSFEKFGVWLKCAQQLKGVVLAQWKEGEDGSSFVAKGMITNFACHLIRQSILDAESKDDFPAAPIADGPDPGVLGILFTNYTT